MLNLDETLLFQLVHPDDGRRSDALEGTPLDIAKFIEELDIAEAECPQDTHPDSYVLVLSSKTSTGFSSLPLMTLKTFVKLVEQVKKAKLANPKKLMENS